MTEIPNPVEVPDTDFPTAVRALANALVQTWKACERTSTVTEDGVLAGENVAEALSYALGLAAVGLGLDRRSDGGRVAGEEGQRLAVEGLVRHRPGCWEADHVRHLTYDVELFSNRAGNPGPQGREG